MNCRNRLTLKQQLFIKAYVETQNATEAARVAGYGGPKKTNLGKIGSEILRLPRIKAAIDAANDRKTKQIEKKFAAKGVTKERWLSKLASIAFSNMRDFAEIKRGNVKLLDTETRKRITDRAIKKISESTSQHGGSQSVELHDPLRALEILGKHFGWVKEKVEHSGPDGGPIRTKSDTLTREERLAEIERLRKLREESGG